MKELSIEEKAKAYDNAIERAIKHRNNDGLTLEQYETIDIIFPELKESEDDIISRELIQNLKERFGTRGSMGGKLDMPKVLALLEKQANHTKFINFIQVGDSVTRNKDGILVNLSQLNRIAKLAEKQGEQKQEWKPTDEQMVVLNDIIINGHLSNANERILKGLQEHLKKLREE